MGHYVKLSVPYAVTGVPVSICWASKTSHLCGTVNISHTSFRGKAHYKLHEHAKSSYNPYLGLSKIDSTIVSENSLL